MSREETLLNAIDALERVEALADLCDDIDERVLPSANFEFHITKVCQPKVRKRKKCECNGTKPFCKNISPTSSGFWCSRNKNHRGQHYACGSFQHKIETWPNEARK